MRGGPSVVYSNGQMGATANFILREGTADPHGDIGLTVGSERAVSLDGFYGAPVTQDWYFSLGGFYRESDGIRPSQYPADNGGQLTGTLAHKWDNGKILFYGRVLNDKNLFITDIPVTVSGTGKNQSVSAFPGFNSETRARSPATACMASRCRRPQARADHRGPGGRARRESPHVRRRPGSTTHRHHRLEQQDAVHGRRRELLLLVQQPGAANVGLVHLATDDVSEREHCHYRALRAGHEWHRPPW